MIDARHLFLKRKESYWPGPHSLSLSISLLGLQALLQREKKEKIKENVFLRPAINSFFLK